jgi:uncharacterized small protein (DUF1192 family)
MTEPDPCETPHEMRSDDVDTEFLDSVEELEHRIAADLQQGRERGATENDDAAPDGGQER